MNWTFNNGWWADTGSENGGPVVRIKHDGELVDVMPGRPSTDQIVERIGQLKRRSVSEWTAGGLSVFGQVLHANGDFIEAPIIQVGATKALLGALGSAPLGTRLRITVEVLDD